MSSHSGLYEGRAWAASVWKGCIVLLPGPAFMARQLDGDACGLLWYSPTVLTSKVSSEPNKCTFYIWHNLMSYFLSQILQSYPAPPCATRANQRGILCDKHSCNIVVKCAVRGWACGWLGRKSMCEVLGSATNTKRKKSSLNIFKCWSNVSYMEGCRIQSCWEPLA